MNAEYIRLCSITAVQEKIKKEIGEWEIGDLYYDPCSLDEINYGVNIIQSNDFNFNGDLEHGDEGFIRLPQVHDLNDEKRGLWGMVDWNRWIGGSSVDGSGFYMIHQILDIEFNPATPELALLRACMFQWGIKDELVVNLNTTITIKEI